MDFVCRNLRAIQLEKSVDSLYAKYVPANVREFIDMKGSQVKTPKPKKPKIESEDKT